MPPLPASLLRAAAIPARWRPDRVTLLLAALSLLGAGLALARTATYGVALEGDQVNYIGAARNLLDGAGLVNVLGDEGYYTWRPPLYPLLLAAASLGVFDPYDVAAPLNAFIFGLTVFVMGQYLRRRLESRFLFWWACIAVALSIPLAYLAAHALSGALFILMATLALIWAHKYLDEGKRSALIWAAAFSALAWQTRYIGISVPATVGLLLLLQSGATLPQRARHIAVHSLIVAAPMGLWLLRNYIRTGEITGARQSIDYSAGDFLGDIGNILAKGWERFAPSFADAPPTVILYILAAIAVIILIPAGMVLVKSLWETRRRDGWLTPVIFCGFALVYFAALISGIISGNTYYGIESRYLFPLYLPILTAGVWTLDRFISYARDGMPAGSGYIAPAKRKISLAGLLAVFLMTGLCILAAGMAVMQAREINRANSFGSNGFSNQVWADSDVLQYIRDNPIAGQVYSNQSLLLYIYTDGNADYRRLPRSYPSGYISGEPVNGQKQLRQWIENAPAGAYVVWLHNWYANDLFDYDAADLRASPRLELAADLEDGVIFRVSGEQE